MKSEYEANLTMQASYKGKYNSPKVLKTQGKHDTMNAMLQSYLTKFAALATVALTPLKHFI